jgi:hypothetical protein
MWLLKCILSFPYLLMWFMLVKYTFTVSYLNM